MRENDLIEWLQNWYASHCDGEWEHGYGVRISTIDNPGWSLKVNLKNTALQGKNLNTIKRENSETDWVFFWVKDDEFHAAGGAKNLIDMICIFKKWAEYGLVG